MYVGILPAVSKIGLKGVIDCQPVIHEDPEPLCRQGVVLMHLRHTLRKIMDDAVNRMIERYFNERSVRKNSNIDFPFFANVSFRGFSCCFQLCRSYPALLQTPNAGNFLNGLTID